MRILFFLTLLSFSSIAQEYSIGTWKSHFPLNKCIDIAQSQNKIFSASNYGIIILDKSTKEKTVLTKSEGLMDVDLSCVFYNNNTEQLIIGYKSGGIDIVKDGNITSYFDIIRSSILGSKQINNIKLIGGLLHLCTDFGVVVFDDKKTEVKDTYYIGVNGDIAAHDIIKFNTTLFVATEFGVYSASENSILSNKNNWKQEELPYPSQKFDAVFEFNNMVFANMNGGTYFSDTLYQYSNSLWTEAPFLKESRNKSFQVKDNKLLVAMDYDIGIYDTAFVRTDHVYQYSSTVGSVPNKVIFDDENLSTLWCADNKSGLVKVTNIWNSMFYNYKLPSTNSVNKIKISNNQVWVATGGVSGSQWQNVWMQEGVNYYDGFDWASINKTTTTGLDTIFDFIDIAIDPSDENHVFVATLGDGIIELQNNEVVNHFSDNNSSLQRVESGNDSWWWIAITSVSFDNNGNLWAVNHSVDELLSVYDTEENWHSIDVRQYTNAGITGDLMVTSNDQLWLVFPKTQGILIYEANQTFDDTSDDNGIVLSQSYGLPSNTVFSLAEDNNGDIWIGTDKGIAVVYSPQSIFTGGGLEANKILIEQDGYTEYLLENNTVSAISVDGANQKWIGTRSSGVFLLSSDGTQELARFTTENSPLPSNEIKTIAINKSTGEIFFGTEKGIVSYRGEATQGVVQHSTVIVYPNPVRETYSGPIAIKGLTTNANVKITDTSGNLVFETTSVGGQAIWYGHDFNGNRVASGVYLVFSASNDGVENVVSKILFIN